MTYEDIKSKFIVVENMSTNEKFILIGRCIFHKELMERITARHNEEFKCLGGGEWELIRLTEEDKIPSERKLILKGESHDFGRCSIEILKEIVINRKIFNTPFFVRDMSDRNVVQVHIENIETYPATFNLIPYV